MTFGSPQGPGSQFGGPPPNRPQGQPHQPAAPAGSAYATQDYRYGNVAESQRETRRAADMKALWAPWPLKIVAVIELFICAYGVYTICQLVAHENSPTAVSRMDRLSTEFGVFIGLLVLLVCVLTTYVLHAQQVARIALTAISAVLVLLIPVDSVMPVSIASVAVIVLLWLPANRRWFGGTA